MHEDWAKAEAEAWQTFPEELIFISLRLFCGAVIKVTVKPCFTVKPTALKPTASLSLSADIGTHRPQTADGSS